MSNDFRASTAIAVDNIDAALFTGDEFVSDPAARVNLRRYLVRWNRQLSELASEDEEARFNERQGNLDV